MVGVAWRALAGVKDEEGKGRLTQIAARSVGMSNSGARVQREDERNGLGA